MTQINWDEVEKYIRMGQRGIRNIQEQAKTIYHTPTNLVAVDKNGQELSEGDIVYYNDGEDFAGDVMNIFEDRGVWLVDILPHHDNNYFRCEAREVEIA